jgi:DNA-binding transcriptional ArsR family regulator
VCADIDLAAVGMLLADRARADILLELLGGEPLPAGELARRVGISPSGASNHLKKLLSAALVEVHAFGRQRVYRLADREVAEALEALGRIAPGSTQQTLRASQKRQALERARSCYDHLAGRLGVALADRLLGPPPLGGSSTLTADGEQWLLDILNIDTRTLATLPGPIAIPCDDITEGRPHLGGPLGAAVSDALLKRGFVQRRRDSRALRVTRSGFEALAALGVAI